MESASVPAGTLATSMAGFVCIYYGNTGSSWLLHALGSSRSVWVPGFEPIEGWAWKVDPAERIAWLETMLTLPREEGFDEWVAKVGESPQVKDLPPRLHFTHTGIKMNDLAATRTDAVLDVLDRTGAKVIHLTRANRLKHALSMYRYHDEKKSQFHGKDSYEATTVDFTRFKDWIKESERLHGQGVEIGEKAVARLGPDRVFPLTYEEFLTSEGKEEVLARLAAFLDIDPHFGDGNYSKATPDTLRSAIANYGMFSVRMRLAGYGRDLD